MYGGGGASDIREAIEQFRNQQTAYQNLGFCLGKFLSKAFPHAVSESSDLALAFVALMDCGTDKQIERMESQAASMGDTIEKHRDSCVSQLADCQLNISRLSQRLEELKEGIERAKDADESESLTMMMATTIPLLEQQLSNLRREEEYLQSQLDSFNQEPSK